MSKNGTAKLTSEERCRKAFEEWFAKGDSPVTPIMGGYYERMFIAWAAAWHYLESRVTEFIEQ